MIGFSVMCFCLETRATFETIDEELLIGGMVNSHIIRIKSTFRSIGVDVEVRPLFGGEIKSSKQPPNEDN